MPIGRPPKFTKEVTEKILYAIRLGAYYEMACNYAGCAYPTFRRWLVDAEENEDSPYREFRDALKEAEGESGLACLEVIQKAMDGEVWQSAAWRLERRHPKYYSANAAIVELAAEINEMREQMKKGVSNGKAKGAEKKGTSKE